jgi:phosphoribosylformylglycinamidine synthase
MKATVNVTLKSGVLDPQGKAIEHTLHELGFDEVMEVKQGKVIELEIMDNTREDRIKDMCDKLLANPVIEDYKIEISDK